MRKWFGIIVAGLLAVSTLALAGCGAGGRDAGAGERDNAAITKVVAATGKISGGAVVSGKLEALESAEVVPKIAGRVADIPVDVGSLVAAGDVLVQLDAAELAALVDLYAAQLDKARNSDLPAQKNQAELALANAEAAYKTAEADYERSKQLRDASVISQQQFEQAEKIYTQAKAAYEAARNSLDILVNATIPETIRQCEAQLNKAQADYANSVIRAPISGVVTARNVNPGEMAGPTRPVVTLVNLDTVAIRANAGEDLINCLKAGQEIKVKVGSVQDEPFTGTVTNIALAADPSTKAYPVKIQIPNPRQLLKPGMFAEVYLGAGEEEGIVIPKEAVLREGEKSFAWVIKDGRVTRREVVAGRSDGSNVIVKSGLNEGEEVAVTGLDALREGAVVNVQD